MVIQKPKTTIHRGTFLPKVLLMMLSLNNVQSGLAQEASVLSDPLTQTYEFPT